MSTGNVGKVIILGCEHSGLALVRSFGRHGLDVMVLSYNEHEAGLASRYIKEWHICPHPKDIEGFVNYLLSYADDWRGALIMETDDYFLQALSTHKERLSQTYKLVTPDWDMAQLFIQKTQTYALADACGVLHPSIYLPKSMAELEALASDITFPVMIKPVLSHAFAKIFQTKLFILETFADLREKFQTTLDANVAVMISEIIPGTDYETLERFHLYINSKGDATGENFYLKMRQLPPMFGVMRVGRTVPPIDDLRELGHRLLKQANYRGLANFEFKRDPRDNQLKLIEVNIRPSRGLALEVASGVDMPWLIYQDLVLNQQPIVTEYRHDIYFIDVIADIIEFLRHDEDRHFGRFIQPYFARHKVFPFLIWSDPMPFFRQQKIRLTSGFEKLIRRLRGE